MTPQPDLSSWPSKPEAARLLGIGERTLDRQMARTGLPEVRMRPRDGRKPEPVCNPEHVQEILQRRNRTVLMPSQTASAAVAVRPPDVSSAGPLSEILLRSFGATFQAVATAPRPADALWLTLKEASRYSGLSMALLQRLAATGRLGAIKDNGWKFRRAALDSLDVEKVLTDEGL